MVYEMISVKLSIKSFGTYGDKNMQESLLIKNMNFFKNFFNQVILYFNWIPFLFLNFKYDAILKSYQSFSTAFPSIICSINVKLIFLFFF